MTKKEFMVTCAGAIVQKKGITVFVGIPENNFTEEIFNHPEDVYKKSLYYNKTYGENMEHNHAPVKIESIIIGRRENK